jgi:hypothetical protein
VTQPLYSDGIGADRVCGCHHCYALSEDIAIMYQVGELLLFILWMPSGYIGAFSNIQQRFFYALQYISFIA